MPAWMTLGWVNQVMAYLGRPEGKHVLPILRSLAKDYPQALFYPLSISFPEEDQETLEEEAQERVSEVRSLVRNDYMDQFVNALLSLTHPELRFKVSFLHLITLLK